MKLSLKNGIKSKATSNIVHYGCEKVNKEKSALSVHPSAKVAGKLALKIMTFGSLMNLIHLCQIMFHHLK